MEQDWRHILPENEEKKTEKKDHKRSNFFLEWLAARRRAAELQPENHDSLEDEEGVEKPKKRRQRWFRVLFTKHVHTEPVAERSSGYMAAKETATHEGTADESERGLFTTERKKEPEEDRVSKSEAPEPEDHESFERKPIEEEHGVLKVPRTAPIPEFLSFPIPEEVISRDAAKNTEPANVEPAEDYQPEKTSSAAVEASDGGRRGEPLAALTLLGLGAEYIGRKHENRAQDKRIERTERELEKQLNEQTRLTNDVSRVEKKIPRANPEVVVEKRDSHPEPAFIEREPKIKEETLAPIQKEKLAEEAVRKVEAYERRQEAPTVVLKEMLNAAEVNAPVERLYERRQEVKDEPGSQFASSGAAHIGSILQEMSNAKNNAVATGGSAKALGSQTTPEQYRQAAERGFWGAIVILIFALMVYLLR
jgi:hypothetical protein